MIFAFGFSKRYGVSVDLSVADHISSTGIKMANDLSTKSGCLRRIAGHDVLVQQSGGYTRSVNQHKGVMFDERTIRPAVVEDAPAIAQVHVESWKTTYKGIFPESLLDRLSVSDRTRFWNEILAKPSARFVTLVACDEAGRVVGFVCGGAERTGQLGCDGELQAMYLLEGVQRRGLGTLLIRRFVRELRSVGFNSMAVWVLARNPSRRFYEVLGGELITEQQIDRGGESYAEIAYGWSDLSEFPAQSASPG